MAVATTEAVCAFAGQDSDGFLGANAPCTRGTDWPDCNFRIAPSPPSPPPLPPSFRYLVRRLRSRPLDRRRRRRLRLCRPGWDASVDAPLKPAIDHFYIMVDMVGYYREISRDTATLRNIGRLPLLLPLGRLRIPGRRKDYTRSFPLGEIGTTLRTTTWSRSNPLPNSFITGLINPAPFDFRLPGNIEGLASDRGFVLQAGDRHTAPAATRYRSRAWGWVAAVLRGCC